MGRVTLWVLVLGLVLMSQVIGLLQFRIGMPYDPDEFTQYELASELLAKIIAAQIFTLMSILIAYSAVSLFVRVRGGRLVARRRAAPAADETPVAA